MSQIALLVLLAATAMTGLLTGASLDQSIKQLPARHKIGAKAYSAYAQAADLGNGIAFYAIMGIGAALLTIIAVILAFQSSTLSSTLTITLILAAALAVAHSLMTTQAAPKMLSQHKVADDEAALHQLFNRFEFWQALRAIFQVLNFLALLAAIYIYIIGR